MPVVWQLPCSHHWAWAAPSRLQFALYRSPALLLLLSSQMLPQDTGSVGTRELHQAPTVACSSGC